MTLSGSGVATIRPVAKGKKAAGRQRPEGGQVIFTIASQNYISLAATLMQSVRRHHPDSRRFIILADTPRPFPALDLAAELLPCDALGIGQIDNMRLWYSVIEFNTALKPFACRHLLDRGFSEICYLDPDIVLYAPLAEAFDALRKNSIVLTPHLLQPLTPEPIPDDRQPDDLTILKSGVYNLGFLALRNDSDARHLIDWWAARCTCQCRVDVAANLFTDQRWIDLAPGFVGRTAILRHPGYNVAYWNLAQRAIRHGADGWTADGEPLVFFHFSGLDPGDAKIFSAFQTRFSADMLGDVAILCADYRKTLEQNNWQQTTRAPYGYGAFPDGRPIEGPMRRWLLRAVDEARLDGAQPLAIASDYFDLPDETAAARGIPMTRMMYQMWLDRADLRMVFDVHTPDGLDSFVTWFTGPDSEVDGRSQDAASRLHDRHMMAGAGAGMAGEHPPALPAWEPVAATSWDGQAADVTAWLGRDAIGAGGVLVPLLAALAWERRPDLQMGFPLAGPDGIGDFIGWALTAGSAEGVIDPALLSSAFCDQQIRLAPIAARYAELPVTEGLWRTRHAAQRRDFLNGWAGFPTDRQGCIAHALWFAHVAPDAFGWPEDIAAPIRRFLSEPSEQLCAGFAFNRGEIALWELRPDLRRHFPLDTPAGAWGFLHWIATDGLRELGLTLDAFDPRLRPFLGEASPRLPGIAVAIEMVHAARPDLQAAFDITTQVGRDGLMAWVHQNFAAAYAGYPLLAVRPSPPAPIAPTTTHHARIGLTGQFFAPTGRAEDLRSAVASLTAAGFLDFVVIDMDQDGLLDADGTELPPGCHVSVAINIVYRNADTAADDWKTLAGRRVSAKKTIGCWAWELENLPDIWLHAFSFVDEIWAATRFARDAFGHAGRRPVTLMPMAVIAPAARIPAPDIFEIDPNATNFLFIFDFRSHAVRKNPEAVVAAFRAAFPGDEDVRLLIKTQGGAAAPGAWRRLTALCADDPRIVLRDAVLPREKLAWLLAGCDAFVSLHRAEGFGRLPAEAMLLGTPVIATAWSGTADFIAPGMAHAIGHRMVPVPPGAYPGSDGQLWAEPDSGEASRAMRAIHDHPAAARALGMRGKAHIRELYEPARIGAAMLEALGVTMEA